MPVNYIERVLQLARQGFTSLRVRGVRHRLELQGLLHRLRPEQQQLGAHRQRLHGGGAEGRPLAPLLADGEGEGAGARAGAPKPCKTLRARDLWDQIAYAAWSCADPGVQFDTTINEWHTCPADGRINASNPCSEYMFLDDTACNLASLNLLQVLRRRDRPLRRRLLPPRLPALDADPGNLRLHGPVPERRRSPRSPTTSARSAWVTPTSARCSWCRAFPTIRRRAGPSAAPLTALMHAAAYATSAEIAAEVGPFPRFAANREAMLRVIRNHRRAAYNAPREEYEGLTITPVGIDERYCPDYLLAGGPRASATACWSWARSTATATPRSRCIAPTGTIGLVMDCDTTGVEPDFALVKFKKLAGGGYFKIINASIPPALARLGYTPEQIDDIVRYCRGAGTLQGCPHINPASLKAKGFTDDVLAAHRGAAARRLRAALRLQSLDGRRRLLLDDSSASRRSSSRRPASTC